MREPYNLLGVSENASEDEIRRSYRKLVRKHHPDLNPEDPNAEERFKELQQAYETLTNPANHGGSRQRSGPRPRNARQPGGRAEFSGNLSDLLRKLGHRPKSRADEGAGRVREIREEDVARLLKRFGIDTARASKVRVSFGDAADFVQPPDEKKTRPEKPPVNEDLRKPPKPPKPPKW
jgi:curved DNA-binding protein CbpA